jgi:hypothetical protein
VIWIVITTEEDKVDRVSLRDALCPVRYARPSARLLWAGERERWKEENGEQEQMKYPADDYPRLTT